jgi:signal transduction histidine kinase
MRLERTWNGSSRALAALLLAVVVPPAAMLGWLGAQLLQQDRSLLAQREIERHGAVAQTAVHALEASITDAERRLADGAVPDGMVRLTFGEMDVASEPANRVSWLPAPRQIRTAESAPFSDAEALEFMGGAARALLVYQQMSGARDPAVRAGALLRAARVFRQQRRWDDALLAYGLLAEIRDVAIEGSPADFQARRATCGVLEESGRTTTLARAALELEADLVSGRWLLDHPAWELTAAEVERWTDHALPIAADRGLFSTVTSVLWEERERSAWPGRVLSGRRLVGAGDTSVTVVWRTQDAVTMALAISPSVLRAWTARAIDSRATTGDRLSVLTPTGQVMADSAPAARPPPINRHVSNTTSTGRVPADSTAITPATSINTQASTTISAGQGLAGTAPTAEGSAIRMAASDTGLPWTVVLTPGTSPSLTADLAARRRLLSVGLVAILLFVAGASYFLWRVVRRELAVVRQQQDFVAAVSHEFRTPLTSLRHVTELLQESDDVPPVRRHAFYDALSRNTERLQRLVESLLDFSRMEGGKKPYDLQPLDADRLVEHIVADFQQEVGPTGVTVHVEIERGGALSVRGDSSALTNAVWNLLDNAVKYSPDAHGVHVSVARHPAGVAIAVRDEGFGIPANERKDVFRRFVRGEQATRLGIKGTGLGLAIVSHIVSAHGGTIELESEEGAGSTFRLVLPARE